MEDGEIYVRARKRGKVDFCKAKMLPNYFGTGNHGYVFVDQAGNHVSGVFRNQWGVVVAGPWVDEKVGML